MTELSDRATDDPASVTDGELEELVGRVIEDPDSPAVDAVVAVLEADPSMAGTAVAAVRRRLAPGTPRDDLRNAVDLAADLVVRQPEQAASLVPAVLPLVEHDNALVSEGAARALERVGGEAGAAVADHRDTVAGMLADENVLHRSAGAELAVSLAAEDPAAARPLLSELVALVGSEYESAVPEAGPDAGPGSGPGSAGATGGGDPTRPAGLVEHDRQRRKRHQAATELAAEAVAAIAEHDPAAVADHAAALGEVVGTTDSPVVRYSLVDALAPVAEAHPGEAMVALDALADCLGSGARSRDLARAARTLSFLADADQRRVAEAVRPHLDAVLDLLEAGDPGVRRAAAGLLMYVAEEYPDPVAGTTDALLAMLEADEPGVRGSAAWVLGVVGGEEARQRLAGVAEADPVEEVRAAAAQAAERIGRG